MRSRVAMMLSSNVLLGFFFMFCCSLQADAMESVPNIIVMLMDDVCSVHGSVIT